MAFKFELIKVFLYCLTVLFIALGSAVMSHFIPFTDNFMYSILWFSVSSVLLIWFCNKKLLVFINFLYYNLFFNFFFFFILLWF